MSFREIVLLLAEHEGLFELIASAIVKQSVPEETLVLAIKEAMKAASEARIDQEFPNG